MKLLQSEVRDIAAVLDAWSSEDDWNVKAIYVSTARELIADLGAGDDPVTLIRYAKGQPADVTKIPNHIERERRADFERRARKGNGGNA